MDMFEPHNISSLTTKIKPVALIKEELRMGSYFQPKNIKSLFENMINNMNLKIIASTIALGFDWLFGADKQYLLILATLIVIDSITGFLLAAKRNNVSSYGFYRFSAKVLVYFMLCATGRLIDMVLPIHLAHSIMFSFLSITP